VMPGSSPTMARRDPMRRLKRVDLPTLGRPTIAITGAVVEARAMAGSGLAEIKSVCGNEVGLQRESGAGADCIIISMASSSHSAPTQQHSTGKELSLFQFFSPGGVLSRAHPAYEFRRGQLQMAQAVERALEERRHLIVEAGTGTGKTLAYLLPVILSGKRVIISTGTKNLQEQLFFKHEGAQQLSVPEKIV
jgi:hypothetical protein